MSPRHPGTDAAGADVTAELPVQRSGAGTSPPRALVTGASGFIGRHLVRRLLADGWQVSIASRATSRTPVDITGRCQVIPADAAAEEFAWAVERFRPTVCFHLATYFSNGSDAGEAEAMIDSNISYGVRVLEAVTRLPGTTFVNVGSRMQHLEAAPFRPVSLYAATKQAFMDVMTYYAGIKELAAVTVELPDTFGSDDPRPKLLPLLRRAALSGDPLLMSPGGQLIEILHVDDVLRALLLSRHQASTEAPTFSLPGHTLPLRQFVREVELALGRPVPITWGARPYRDREMMSSWLYWPALPGWAPVVGLDDGLRAVLGSASVDEPATVLV